MIKTIDVCGLGNSLVDILVQIPNEHFLTLGLERGSSRLYTPQEQAELLSVLSKYEAVLVSGGSVANSIIALAQLGGRGAFLTSIGDDRYGLHYQSEFSDLDIIFPNPPGITKTTGTCATLITPDGERTMRINLAASQDFASKHLDQATIAKSKWLFIEGYLLANPTCAFEAILKAIDSALRSDTKIALTLSEHWVVESNRKSLEDILPKVDLLFANKAEAFALTSTDSVDQAIKKLSELVPNYVMSLGPDGAQVKLDEQSFHTPAFACQPLDLTGAGDMLAGTFLYGITNNFSAQESARAACYLAREVITRIGARLVGNHKQYWEEGLSK